MKINTIQLVLDLNNLKTNCFFFTTPDPVSFTKPFTINLISPNCQTRIPNGNIIEIISFLKSSIFKKDCLLFCWNIKSLFSYVKRKTRKDLEVDCQLVDLKVIESYQGIKLECPQTWQEVIQRVKDLKINKEIYKKIHLPLITKVVPAMETEGLYHKQQRKLLFSHYEIEGQVNGRMLCYNPHNYSFNPHTLSHIDKLALKPRDFNELFINLDFRNMEVSMIQWLTKDPTLTKILKLEKDFYEVLTELLNGPDRDFAKNIFLPVIYGQTTNSLAQKLNLSFEIADNIVKKLYQLFPKAFSWINEKSKVLDYCEDVLGRRRYFNNETNKIKNFLIQSPSALVCLENLIKVYEKVKGYGKLVCHIHDGYVIRSNKKTINIVAEMLKNALEEESEIFPELRLKVVYQIGEDIP